MSHVFEYSLIAVAILLLLSVIASKLSDRLGVPALLLFLVIGMLAGSDGPGGIYFDNPELAQYIGILALAVILFSGGLDTEWKSIRPVIRVGLLLATAGIVMTALIMGAFVHYILNLPWLESLLVGAIVSSTDAAAVFGILRSQGVRLKDGLGPLIEFESGSNDPMAVFLTIGLIQLITLPKTTWLELVGLFFLQMILGGLIGFLAGKLGLLMINRLRLGYEGLYPVLTFGLVLLAFGVSTVIGGSGFLAVYLAGIVMGQRDFLHKRGLVRFYDGFTWLMQILMFLTLGLLVFPSKLVTVLLPALLVALALILVARPVSVFLSLLPVRFPWRQKAFISWVGLRGAVPIVLATYPYLAGIEHADLIFNVVFFVVLTSILFQGTSLSFFARWLKVEEEAPPDQGPSPVVLSGDGLHRTLRQVNIAGDSPAVGKAIYELGLPEAFLIVLVRRQGGYLVPNGSLDLQAGDELLVLAGDADYAQAQRQVEQAGKEKR
jgi:potassium/hydrogen antiporter